MHDQGQTVIQDGRGQRNPYGLGERLARLLWAVTSCCLFRPVPKLFGFWHRFLLRLFGARLGKGVLIYPSARIFLPWRVRMGDYSILGPDVLLYSLGHVEIGRHTVISMRASVYAGTHDYTDPRMPLIRSPVTIGEGCWICAEAYIGPGVRVGDGSVVGARSVVVKDLPPHMVCAGHPCVPIKPRLVQHPKD